MDTEKKTPEINSKHFYKLITEHGETVAKNTAARVVEEVKDYLDCHDTCSNKSNEMYYWMGFRKLFNRFVPVTYIIIASIAIVALLLSIYNL